MVGASSHRDGLTASVRASGAGSGQAAETPLTSSPACCDNASPAKPHRVWGTKMTRDTAGKISEALYALFGIGGGCIGAWLALYWVPWPSWLAFPSWPSWLVVPFKVVVGSFVGMTVGILVLAFVIERGAKVGRRE